MSCSSRSSRGVGDVCVFFAVPTRLKRLQILGPCVLCVAVAAAVCRCRVFLPKRGGPTWGWSNNLSSASNHPFHTQRARAFTVILFIVESREMVSLSTRLPLLHCTGSVVLMSVFCCLGKNTIPVVGSYFPAFSPCRLSPRL